MIRQKYNLFGYYVFKKRKKFLLTIQYHKILKN